MRSSGTTQHGPPLARIIVAYGLTCTEHDCCHSLRDERAYRVSGVRGVDLPHSAFRCHMLGVWAHPISPRAVLRRFSFARLSLQLWPTGSSCAMLETLCMPCNSSQFQLSSVGARACCLLYGLYSHGPLHDLWSCRQVCLRLSKPTTPPHAGLDDFFIPRWLTVLSASVRKAWRLGLRVALQQLGCIAHLLSASAQLPGLGYPCWDHCATSLNSPEGFAAQGISGP